jgi:chromosome segregation ATPase
MYIMSKRLSVTVPDELDEKLPYDEYDSKSSTVVEYVERGFELDTVEAERDDLRRQLREVNRQQQDVDDLVEYVEDQRERERKRAEKEDAPAWTRAKWWMFGYDPE